MKRRALLVVLMMFLSQIGSFCFSESQTNATPKEIFSDVRLHGIMKCSDETYKAIINTNLVSVGDSLHGYKITKITESEVALDVNGQHFALFNGDVDDFGVPNHSGLNLEKIVEKDGVWVALINKSFYRSGDWIDKKTQVRTVTSKKAMISRGGNMIVLQVEEKAAESVKGESKQ